MTLVFKLMHPFRIYVHKENAASIENDRDIRVLLLKEPSILYDDVHMFPLRRYRVLLKLRPGPTCTHCKVFSFSVIGIEQHLIPKLCPGSARQSPCLHPGGASIWW
jgi:hypothetical protein